MNASRPGRFKSSLRRLRGVTSALLAALITHSVAAADLGITLHAGDGTPLDAAIVALYPHDETSGAVSPTLHTMDQVNKQFVPRLLAVHVGDEVRFPNSDNIRHHVYSFSPARTFELPLYRGIPSAPVRFAQAGKVVLGCNIHDRMSAHIYVLDTALYAVAEQGHHTFTGLAPGNYDVAVFHPRQSEADDGARHALTVSAGAAQQIDLTVNLIPVPAAPDSEGLSPLERKFQELRRGTH